MPHIIKIRTISFLIFTMTALILCFALISQADSFPFRAIKPGEQLPEITLTHVESKKVLSFDHLQGQSFAILFWGMSGIESKRKRSLSSLQKIEELTPFLKERKLPILAVNVLEDSFETINSVAQKGKLTMPMYADIDQAVYGELGIYVLPAILLVGDEGQVVAGHGYSRDMAGRFKGDVEIYLGEKTKEQVEKDLNPQMEVKDEKQKSALRHLNLGRVLLKRSLTDAAAEEFEKALTFDAQLPAANFELGCLYVKEGKLQLAAERLEVGLEAEPDSIKGQICECELKAHSDLEEAIDDLQFLAMKNGRNHELRFLLSKLYIKKGETKKAYTEIRKAYDLLLKKQKFD